MRLFSARHATRSLASYRRHERKLREEPARHQVQPRNHGGDACASGYPLVGHENRREVLLELEVKEGGRRSPLRTKPLSHTPLTVWGAHSHAADNSQGRAWYFRRACYVFLVVAASLHLQPLLNTSSVPVGCQSLLRRARFLAASFDPRKSLSPRPYLQTLRGRVRGLRLPWHPHTPTTTVLRPPPRFR